MLAARVRADLKRSRTPRQIAGRLRLEAEEASVETMSLSPDAYGKTMSHEAIYRWIYVLSKGGLVTQGNLLRSKRTNRKLRKGLGERGVPIVGMVSIDDRPEAASDRRVPGAWEEELIIGARGQSAAVTLVERHSRHVVIPALPEGQDSAGVADALIEHVTDLHKHMRGSLTWDHGSEMAKHAQLTLATKLPVYFAHPRSPCERPSNENLNSCCQATTARVLG